MCSSSPSSRPTPRLLWQVLSTTFDSSATACTSSCASSRCLNSCSPFCHLRPTSPCESHRVGRNLHLVTGVLRHMRPLLLTSTRSGRRLFRLPDDVRLPSDSSSAVLSSPGSLIVTFLLSATSTLPALELVHHSSGRSPFVAFSVSAVFPATDLAAVVHLLRAPILRFFCCLLNNLLFLNVGPLFVYFVCCNIINTLRTVGFLAVRWYSQPLADILCASTVSVPRRTSRYSHRSAFPSPSPSVPHS